MGTGTLDLELTFRPRGQQGSGTLLAAINGQTIYSDDLTLTTATERERAVAALCDRRPGINATDVQEELLRLAANAGQQPDRRSQASKIVELVEGAELFHSPGTDGVAYATVTNDAHANAE